jgi:hypothetical protein
VAVLATTILGLAGIAAAFFAPSWVQTRLERRREKRDFRRATRLVAHEARKNWVWLECLESLVDEAEDGLPATELNFFWTEQWDRESGVLAASLRDSDWERLHFAYGLLISVRALYELDEEMSDDDRQVLRVQFASAKERFEQVEIFLKSAERLAD